MLSTVKAFEILPKGNVFGFISESFGLSWYIFCIINIKRLYFHCNGDVNKIFRFCEINRIFSFCCYCCIIYSLCWSFTKIFYICIFYYQYVLMWALVYTKNRLDFKKKWKRIKFNIISPIWIFTKFGIVC